MRTFVFSIMLMGLVGCAGSQPIPVEPVSKKEATPDVVRKYFALTPEQEKAAKDIVLSTLKDPESARFGKIVGVGDPEGTGAYSACGSVNAKNSYGGYVGDKLFAVAAGRVLMWDSSNGGRKSFDNKMILLLCKPNA